MDNDIVGHGMGIDYATYAKRTFLLGLILMIVGWFGEVPGRMLVGELPGWEEKILFYSIFAGFILMVFAVVGFGLILPLTE